MIWALIKAFFLYVFLRILFGCLIIAFAVIVMPGQPKESLIPLMIKLGDWSFWTALVMSVFYFLAAWK